MLTNNAVRRIAENRQIFNVLLAEAASAMQRSRKRSAAAILQTAARFAWSNHPGIYRSPELETRAVEIGTELPSLRCRQRDYRSDVLHVLSQAYSIGGHTRLVWRWIENDPSRVHSVVITGQEGLKIPEELRHAVEQSGGRITTLGIIGDLRTRAQRLRRVVSENGGIVVLHVHPHDIVPLIALAPLRSKVVFLNHADHVFWIGGAVTNVIAEIRPAGQALSLARRSFSPEASTLLPIPLRESSFISRNQARALLNLREDSIVLLSVASGYKYGAPEGHHFVDVHKPFVIAHPNVWLIVVGPDPVDRWADIAAQTNGRFQAVGTKDDLGLYYAASDIYVDSFPVSSLTSLIDAGLSGLAAISFNEALAHSVLTADDISVPWEMQFSSRDEYLRELEALVTQPSHRKKWASLLQEAVKRDHLLPGWNEHLVRLFNQVETVGVRRDLTGATGAPNNNEVFEEGELALVEAHDASGFNMPLWQTLLRDAPFRSFPERIHLVAAVPVGQRMNSLIYLLPDFALTVIKVLWRVVSRRRRG